MSSAPAGFRERKKSATREAIAGAALELFDRDGFDATTLPAIAEAADVSPRTVSAYFPVKEDLVFPDSDAMFERLAERLRGRPAGETTADALREWFREELRERDSRAARVTRQRRVIASDERLRHHERRIMARAEDLIAAAIAGDLGQAPDAVEARMVAAATTAIFSVLGAERDAASSRGRDRTTEETLAILDRALTFVGAGVRALAP